MVKTVFKQIKCKKQQKIDPIVQKKTGENMKDNRKIKK